MFVLSSGANGPYPGVRNYWTMTRIAVAAGGFTVMPARMPHYAYTPAEATEIQLHSTGPWGIT